MESIEFKGGERALCVFGGLALVVFGAGLIVSHTPIQLVFSFDTVAHQQ